MAAGVSRLSSLALTVSDVFLNKQLLLVQNEKHRIGCLVICVVSTNQFLFFSTPLVYGIPSLLYPHKMSASEALGFDLISLKAAAGYTDADERCTDVRVTDEPVEGLRRISLRDVAGVVCNKNTNDAAKVYRNFSAGDLADLAPHTVTIQFKGKGQHKQPGISFEGLLILLMLLPGERPRRYRGQAAKVLQSVTAGDPRLMEVLRTNAAYTGIFHEMAREGVAVAAAASGCVAMPGAEDTLRYKERELELKEREQKLRLKDATVTLKVADTELKVQQKKDAYLADAEARRCAAAREEEAKRRALARDEDDADARHKKRRLDDAAAHERLLAVASSAITERALARKCLFDLATSTAALRQQRFSEADIQGQVAMWRQAAGNGNNDEDDGDAQLPFTVRSFAIQHKLLAAVAAFKHNELLLAAGVQLTAACAARGFLLLPKIPERGFHVNQYPATAAPLARDIFEQLVRGQHHQPDIRSAFRSHAADDDE